MECDREIASNSIERARAASSSSSTKSQDREVIFALPSLHLHFKTEHKQGPTTPLQTGKTTTKSANGNYIIKEIIFFF